jgi:citronellol/citronellal dehydrogenase
MTLEGKTLFITGASRGIGKAIAMRAARDGANIAVVAKTTEPHAKLPGTVYSAVADIEGAGGKGLACPTDIRFEEQIEAAVEATVSRFGGIDIVVNNASAISLTGTQETPAKRFDLMHAVNVRGTYLVSRTCLPHLRQSLNAHILNIAPPLNMSPQWFQSHVAYTMSKYGMSMCVLGMSEEFRDERIAVNALWPATIIATAAVRNLLGGEPIVRRARKPEIMADAAHVILAKTFDAGTGRFWLDEEILKEDGAVDFGGYSVDPAAELMRDLFLDA